MTSAIFEIFTQKSRSTNLKSPISNFFYPYPHHIDPYRQLAPPSPPLSCRRLLWTAPNGTSTLLPFARSLQFCKKNPFHLCNAFCVFCTADQLILFQSGEGRLQSLPLAPSNFFTFRHYCNITLHFNSPYICLRNDTIIECDQTNSRIVSFLRLMYGLLIEVKTLRFTLFLTDARVREW